jgi:alpha-glucosidase
LKIFLQEPVILNENPFNWLATVHHDGSQQYLSELYPALGSHVTIRLRMSANTPIHKVYMRLFPDGEQHFLEMHPTEHQLACQWWECQIQINQPIVHYRFILETGKHIWWYSAAGITAHDPLDNTDFKILADYQPPAWVFGSVFYQIFPDRFANGDLTNDPQPHEFNYFGHGPQTYPWGQPPQPEKPFPLVFYGGDLPGIEQKLPHLVNLGITGLYLNPIFVAYSNHKYDVVDYEQVDPHLGGDGSLIRLREALDKLGKRYILDIVPNHCGLWHAWFQQAQKDPQSPEADFFSFERHPDRYASWLGVWSLPKLNYQSKELRERIYAGPNSIFRRWLRPPFSADGWRVDVANMLARQGPSQLGHAIAREIRQAVKETRKDAYLIGENFFDVSPQLQGDQWDGVMNYAGLTIPLWHWLRGFQQGAWGFNGTIQASDPWPTDALAASLRLRMAVIPWAIHLQQFNLLDSHDTPRIRTIVGGNRALHHLAMVIQFTFPGVPCIYYGDEIGLEDDPALGSRGCMPWDQDNWDQETLQMYQKLIQLRKFSPAIQTGGFQWVTTEQDTFAYLRESTAQRMLIIAHRGLEPRPASTLAVYPAGFPDGVVLKEFFSGQAATIIDGSLLLPEQPQGASIWIESEEDQ